MDNEYYQCPNCGRRLEYRVEGLVVSGHQDIDHINRMVVMKHKLGTRNDIIRVCLNCSYAERHC